MKRTPSYNMAIHWQTFTLAIMSISSPPFDIKIKYEVNFCECADPDPFANFLFSTPTRHRMMN